MTCWQLSTTWWVENCPWKNHWQFWCLKLNTLNVLKNVICIMLQTCYVSNSFGKMISGLAPHTDSWTFMDFMWILIHFIFSFCIFTDFLLWKVSMDYVVHTAQHVISSTILHASCLGWISTCYNVDRSARIMSWNVLYSNEHG
jgi:hypothetical protein